MPSQNTWEETHTPRCGAKASLARRPRPPTSCHPCPLQPRRPPSPPGGARACFFLRAHAHASSLPGIFFLHFSTQLAPLIHSSPCSKVTFSERNLENRLLPASPRVPHTPSSHIVSMIPREALLSPHGPRALLSARRSQASWAFCVAAGFLEAAAVPTRRSDLDSVTSALCDTGHNNVNLVGLNLLACEMGLTTYA